MKKVETLGTLEMNHLMIEEVLFECSDLVKFTKVIDCSKENQYDALLLIKINGEKAKVLNFYSADHMIYEDEYYKKLVEYLQQHTIGLYRIHIDLADENENEIMEYYNTRVVTEIKLPEGMIESKAKKILEDYKKKHIKKDK